VGGGEQRSGSGPTEPHAVCVGREDSGAGGGPGPSSTGRERWHRREQQAPASRTTPLLESKLLPGPHHLMCVNKPPPVCNSLSSLTSPSLQVLEEAVSARFRSVSYLHARGPGLAGHLSALQHGIMADLDTVRHLLEHCVPPHYQLTRAYLRASHRCLHTHLAQVSDDHSSLNDQIIIHY